MPNAWASILWYNMLTNNPKVGAGREAEELLRPIGAGTGPGPASVPFFLLRAVFSCTERELLHQATHWDVGPGGRGAELAVLLYHKAWSQH